MADDFILMIVTVKLYLEIILFWMYFVGDSGLFYDVANEFEVKQKL